MPLTITCPGCAARLKAPDQAAGRTLRCPRCKAAIYLPAAGPAADPAFDPPAAPGDDNPFAAETPDTRETGQWKPRPRAKARPVEGYNPFDPETADADPTGGPPAKRRYRKDADFNPFDGVPEAEEPDPAGGGFEFGREAAPPDPAGEFDFGPRDPRGDDPRRRPR